ncbi:MAG: hypothetical protein VYE27_08600 [Pseudomonadota bacterium]|nr:hypothetical protein [Pseudomonadota bacterium]
MTYKPLGTICIFADGDGEMIIKTVKKFIRQTNNQWCLLILNIKTDTSQCMGDKIMDAAEYSPLVHYKFLEDEETAAFIEKIKTARFWKMFCFAMETASTDFIFFCGELCEPFLNKLNMLANSLRDSNEVAIRTLVGRKPNSLGPISDKQDRTFGSGEGIFDFGLSGFYLDGLIYNIRVLRQTDILNRLKNNFRSKRESPHVHLNIMISSRYRTRFLGKVLSEEIVEPHQKRMEADHFEFNSYGNRCDQIVSFRNALFESFENSQKYLGKQYFDLESFYSSYVKLSLQIAKIMVENDKETYKGHMTNIELVMKSFMVFCIGAVEPLPEYSNYQNFITNEISYGMENLLKEIRSQEISKENLIAS